MIFCIAAIIAALPCAAPTYASDPGPAMFRATPDRTGVFGTGRRPALTTVVWRSAVRGRIYGSPIVAAGLVYVGGSARKLYAFRTSDGSALWTFTSQGAFASTPLYAGGTVYAASTDGNVYALDAQTGKLRWRFETGGERRYSAPGIHGEPPAAEIMPDPFDVFISSPAIDSGVLYFGSGDHNVYAIDAKTGTLKWKFSTGDVVHASPAVAGGVVYVGSWDRYFYAIDAGTGTLRWKYLTGNDPVKHNMMGNGSTAAVSNGVVYFGSRDAHLYALSTKDGRLLWRHDDHGSWVMSSPAVYDGTVCFVTSDERTFEALDAATGRERFHVDNAAFSYSSPSIVGATAYYGTFDGMIYGVDMHTGKTVYRFETDGAKKYRAPHVGADGTLNLRSFDSDGTYEGLIAAFDRIMALGSVVGEVAFSDGTAYAGTTDGTVYALR